MGFNFPNSPTNGQTFTPVGGYQYVWDGVAWRVLEAPQLFATAQSRNRIVNPNGAISQEFGDTFSSASAPTYAVDQWGVYSNGPVASGGRTSGPVSPNGSTTRVAMSIGTGKPSLAAADVVQIYQVVEGIRVKDLGWGTAQAKPVVLRFTALATTVGTYTVAVRNAAVDRSWLGSFTIPTASTDTTFTFAIPGDTTGTWPKDNTAGMFVLFCFAVGATYGGGVAGWQAGDKRGIAGMTNGAAATGAVGVTDVGLYLDPDATGRAPAWQMPDEAEELRACQRYYAKNIITTFCGNVTNAVIYKANAPHPVIMRIVPAYSGTNVGSTGFPAAVGTLNPLADFVQEGRTANATVNSGTFTGNITANARM